MLLKLMLFNVYFNIFIFVINSSISDIFYETFFIPAGIISITRLLLNVLFTAIVFYYVLTNRIKTKAYRWIIILIVCITGSLVFTPEKFEAIKMYINYIGPCCYFILLFHNVDKDRAILYLKGYCNFLVISEILAIFIFKKIGYMDKSLEVIRGIHLSRSTMIIYLNFCIFIYLYYLVLFRRLNNRIKKSIVVMLFLCIVLIILSKSSTGIVIVFLFLPLMMIIKNKRIANIAIIGSISFGVLLPLMNLSSSFFNKIIVALFNKTMTFSGRKYIWDFALDNLLENPFIGSGFNSTDYLFRDKVVPIYDRIAAHSHNGFLDVFLQSGLIGVVLIIGIIYISFKQIDKFDKTEARLIRVYLIVFIIFNSMEPYLLQNISICTLWIVCIFIITYNNKRIRGE